MERAIEWGEDSDNVGYWLHQQALAQQTRPTQSRAEWRSERIRQLREQLAYSFDQAPSSEAARQEWEAEAVALEAEAEAEFVAAKGERLQALVNKGWTRAETQARRAAWNEFARTVQRLPKAQQAAACQAEWKRLGWTITDLKNAVTEWGL